MRTDADHDELELHVSDVAYEVADFVWADLAERVPIGFTYTRPQNEGPYMSVIWNADWKGRVGGPILIKIQGFMDPKHEVPTWWTGKIIRKRSFLAKLLRRPERVSIKPPNSIDTGNCSQCGHGIGYHHADTEEQMLCTVDGCECSGYDEGAMPRSWDAGGRHQLDDHWVWPERRELYRACLTLADPQASSARVSEAATILLNDVELYDDPRQGRDLWLFPDENPVTDELATKLHALAGVETSGDWGDAIMGHSSWPDIYADAQKLLGMIRRNGQGAVQKVR